MDNELAKQVCLDEDGIYEKIFTIETTTSKNAEGERDERICQDKEDKISEVIKDVNGYRRRQNVSKIYDGNGKWEPALKEIDLKRYIKRPRTIRLYWKDRTVSNKVLFAVYKVLRVLHVSLWFYQVPFIFLIGMYFVPIFNKFQGA